MVCGKWLAGVLLIFLFSWDNTSWAQLNPPRRVGEPSPGQPSTNQTSTSLPSNATNLIQPPNVQSATVSTEIPPQSPIPDTTQTGSPSPTTKVLYVFDLEKYLLLQPENKSWQYDVINLVSALQGLVNRQEPKLYILYVHERLSSSQMNVDEFWLRMLRGTGGYLSDYDIVQVKTLEELLTLFRPNFSSIVLWDPNLPATGNVALTISGADGMLPVRFDRSPNSLFDRIVAHGTEIAAQIQLTGKFTGLDYIPDTNDEIKTTKVPKTDAYMWSKLNYLDGNLSSPTHLGFFLDPHDWDPRTEGYQYPDLQQCMIVNHDYYISKKSFFLDLDPWLDETATDSNNNPFNRGIDLYMLQEILKSSYQRTPGHERILRIGGFVPWWIKYSNQYIHEGGQLGVHSPAATAEEFISQISRYNGIIDADSAPIASIANASIYQHVPLPERYFQNPVPPQSPLENKNYLLFVIGDFRSSAQLYQTIPILWQDSLRGEIPLTWAIAPILSERVPHIFEYLYKTRSPNDFFISGAPGAGLCHINQLMPSARPDEMGSGLLFWQDFSQKLYTQFDLHASVAVDLTREARSTSFTLDMQRAFLSFSPQGVGTLKPFETPLVDRIVPFIQEKANFDNKFPPMDDMIKRIVENSREEIPTFHLYRFNLANPTILYTLYQRLLGEYAQYHFQAVDPYTFFYLLREQKSKNDPSANFLLPSYLSNTIPLEMECNGYYPSEIVLRNDGWDTWNPPEVQPNQGHRLTYRWFEEGEQIPGTGWHDAYVKTPIHPGEQTSLNLNILAPDQAGLYRLVLIFGQDQNRDSYFRKEIQIVITQSIKNNDG